MTSGCPKCDYYLKCGNFGTKPHSAACRARITSELSKTDAGQRRIAFATARLDTYVAELGQQYRSDLPQGEEER